MSKRIYMKTVTYFIEIHILHFNHRFYSNDTFDQSNNYFACSIEVLQIPMIRLNGLRYGQGNGSKECRRPT